MRITPRLIRRAVAVLFVLGVPSLSERLRADAIDDATVRLNRTLAAVRTSVPITLDGALDEGAWRDAGVATGFTQSEPDEEQPATEDTEVRVLYDDVTLYIGIQAHDSRPERIIVGDLKKDFNAQSGDAFEVVLDTFHDERNGYMFITNAMGAKWDAQMVNEGREINADWDAVWNVRSRIAADGWSAEMAIPFNSLKFLDADPQTWGINFMRRLRRRNEESYWAPVPRNYRLARVSLAGTLQGLQGLRGGRDVRIKPYALASARAASRNATTGDAAVGLDLKYAASAALVADLTVNTDFSQVETDEQQINTSRVSLFFPEKREFFLENSGVFQFGPGDERGSGSSIRRVNNSQGGSNSNSRLNEVAQPGNDLILLFTRRIGLDDDGEAIPILAGGRLTGRSGPYSVGALNIQQREGTSTPATNISTLRLRRQVLANSDVGVMLLNKDEAGPHFNRTFGADANFRFFSNLNFNGYVARTVSPPGSVGATGSDVSSRIGVNYPAALWNIRASVTTIGERFNDELGFVPRVGVRKFDGSIGPHLRPKAASKWLREWYPHFEWHNIQRSNGDLDSRYIDYHAIFRFQDGSSSEPGINMNTEQLVVPFVLNQRRNIVLQPGRYDFDEAFVWYQPDPSARVGLTGRFAIGEFYSGTSRSYRAGATIRPNERLNITTTLTHNRFRLPEGDFNTNLLTSRVNYSFSTRLFVNALIQYNSDVRQWTTNVRLNFIHRPLSDFFLVYNDQRESRNGGSANRALIGKMTYLLSF
jgi:hypothetical protein